MKKVISFVKMVSAGNDFLVVDARCQQTRPWNAVSRALCDRHQGIGADGVLVLEPSARANVRMRVFNPDGSEAAMCGNGARCVALYLRRGAGGGRRGAGGSVVTIKTKAGLLSATVQRDRVAMRLTDPTDIRRNVSVRVNGRAVRATCLDTGVPHAVVPVTRLDRVDVNEAGRALRFHRVFAPRGTNVDFIQPSASVNRLRLRTYERGVEAETLACGTGVAASAVAYVLSNGQVPGRLPRNGRGRRHRVTVETRSGERMVVSFAVVPSGGGVVVTDLVLEGRARRICEGIINWPLRRSAA